MYIGRTKHSRREIADDYGLWRTFVDPDGHDSAEAFAGKTTEEKLAFISECFGEEGEDEQ